MNKYNRISEGGVIYARHSFSCNSWTGCIGDRHFSRIHHPKNLGEKAIGSAEQKARNLILDAENKSETIKKEIALEAKEEAHRMRSEVEREIKERRNEISKSEKRLIQKENY